MSSIYGGSPPGSGRVQQAASPASGATVVVQDGTNNILVNLTPATLLALLTVQLPSDAGSFIGEEIHIATTKAVTALTISGAVTIYNPLTTLQPGDVFVMEKIGANTWARQQ